MKCLNIFTKISLWLGFIGLFAFVWVVQAFEPLGVPSNTISEIDGADMCYYRIFGVNTAGWAEDSGERRIGCANTTIDLENPSVWRKDGTYQIEIWAKDNANNITDKKTYGPYNIDTVRPVCLVKEIRLHGGLSDNQYFYNGNIYYRGVAGAGEYSVTVDSTDTTGSACSNAGTCVSTLKTVEFENTIGPGKIATYTTPTPTKTETHRYVWSGNSSYALDIFRPDSASRCTDVAGNIAPFTADSNTRVIVEDAGNTPIPTTRFTFTPDTTVPSVSRGNITFASGNDGNGPPENLYDGTNLKYFSATSSRKIALTDLSDSGAGLRPFVVRIENASNKDVKTNYLFTGSTVSTQILGPATVEMNHDFRAAGATPSGSGIPEYDLANGYRNYEWEIETNLLNGTKLVDNICDMVGNCNVFTDTDFRVVANVPDITRTRATLSSTNGSTLIANLSDTHRTSLAWRDQYGNAVLPVTGVKELRTDIAFTNNLGSDQVRNSSSGDGVDFMFQSGLGSVLGWGATGNATAKKDFVFISSAPSDYTQGIVDISLQSAVPTKAEYLDTGKNESMYGSLPANLNLDSLALTPSALGGYTSVGQWSKFEAISSPLGYLFQPSIAYNKIENLVPLIEWREKEVSLERVLRAGSPASHQLFVQPLTSNAFLRFQNLNLEGVGLRNDRFYVGTGNTGWPVGVYSTGDENLQDAEFTGTSKLLKLTPRTIGGISNSDTEVGISTTLRYRLGSKYVQLPGVQTGFQNYDRSRDTVYSPGGTGLAPTSQITLAEIDIRGLTQSRNTTVDNVTTSSAETKFQDFSTISIADLKTDVNKAVEKLLAGKDRSAGIIGGTLTMGSLNFGDAQNKTRWIHLENETIMYVKDTDVVLDCGSVCEIDGKKSLIIENGNLFIKSDMKYANANSVLGLILIGNKDGTKNIVRISENITNGVGVLYSEGPIISAKSNGTLYSGSNIGELDLLNQLYWKGSFATRNTVGGSIKNTPDCPFGTSEYLAGNCNADNSKTYDLIYLRRYGRIAESGIGVTNNSMGDTRVPFGLKEGATVKTAGGRVMTYEAPATVNFGSATLPVPQARSGNVNTYNSPLILEYDAKLQTNPPPGFVKN